MVATVHIYFSKIIRVEFDKNRIKANSFFALPNVALSSSHSTTAYIDVNSIKQIFIFAKTTNQNLCEGRTLCCN